MQHVPDTLAEGVLYVSIEFTSAVHACFCGCGAEVVTPLSPTDWSLTFNGASVALYPSIGSWSLPCRSHYWVNHSRVIWSYAWTDAEIAAGRYREYLDKREFYSFRAYPEVPQTELSNDESPRHQREGEPGE